MHPRISINTISTLAWPLADDLALLDRFGPCPFGFPLLKIEEDLEAGIAAICRTGRRVACVAASSATASLLDPDDALAVLRPAIETAEALASPLCYFTSGHSPERMTTDEACETLARSLGKSVAFAASRGIRLAIENNSMTTRKSGFVHTLADSIWLAEAADLQICLELQNCWYERELARLFQKHVSRLGIVQVSDFRVGEELRLNRRVPGDGSMPLEWLLGALLDAGYAGLFELELIGPAIDAEGPEVALRRSVDWLSERLTKLGA